MPWDPISLVIPHIGETWFCRGTCPNASQLLAQHWRLWQPRSWDAPEGRKYHCECWLCSSCSARLHAQAMVEPANTRSQAAPHIVHTLLLPRVCFWSEMVDTGAVHAGEMQTVSPVVLRVV